MCKCHTDLRKNKIPKAAKTNGFWFGDFTEELQDTHWVELMAASPVRMNRTVFALSEFKVRGVSGSAKTHMRGSFTFCLQNSYAIAQHLSACATDLYGSFACAAVGCKPTVQQLQRLFGARRSTVQALYDFMLDKDNRSRACPGGTLFLRTTSGRLMKTAVSLAPFWMPSFPPPTKTRPSARRGRRVLTATASLRWAPAAPPTRTNFSLSGGQRER